MTTDRWERIAQIYQTAAELPHDGRETYLLEACGDDATLRSEVESLLAQAGATVLIDRPVWEAAAQVLDDNPAVRPGNMIGPFRVESLIGEGGMGQVYRARDTTLQRDVALKVLPGAFARDPDRLTRFEREAQVLAALNHPHIGAIFGFERSVGVDESPVNALVLEFVDGPTLADRIARGPLPLDEALPIARQIAEAVEAAHEQGIVHRDLKPANVKLGPDGTVKVLDFGLAKVFSPVEDVSIGGQSLEKSPLDSPAIDSPVVTAHGMIVGTATYMSPEQVKGRAAGKRSDVWAFGCVLFEMLTGTRAFSGDDVSDTLAAIRRGEPDWNKLPAEAPPAIARLLRRCLKKDPKRRLPAIGAARFEIEDALSDRSIEERVTSGGPPGLAWRRWALWMTVAALVAGVIGGSVVTWLRAAAATGDTRVIRFTISQPQDTVLGGYLRPGSPTSQPQFAVSPDGRHVVMVANRQGVESLTQLTWMDRTGRRLDTVGEPARNAAFALSPDGSRIAVTRDPEAAEPQHLWIIDVASGLSSQLTFGRTGRSLPVWSPDSTRVAFAGTAGPLGFDIFARPADGRGTEERLLQREGSEIPSDWSRDDRFLLFTQVNPRDLDVWVLPLTGERQPFPFTETPHLEDAATFSPDGRWVAYQSDESGDDEIYVQPFPSTGAKARISRGGGRAPRWRGDGKELFYLARDGSITAASLSIGVQVTAVASQQLFPTDYNRRRGRRFFSVTPDGQRFLVPVYQDPLPTTPLTVIVNWPATLVR